MTIQKARKFMAKELKNPGLRQAYLANIAMCICDNRTMGRLNQAGCNVVAEKLLKLIFES